MEDNLKNEKESMSQDGGRFGDSENASRSQEQVVPTKRKRTRISREKVNYAEEKNVWSVI